MRHLKLTLAYDGTDYNGWQIQTNGSSIQEKLERAWSKITGESIRITASGRTDAGVHARAQVCSIQTESKIPAHKLVMALNCNTPYDICVLKIEEARPGFHAIRNALKKTYRYRVQYGPLPDVLSRRQVMFVRGHLDVDAIRAAGEYVRGTHDFLCFQATGSVRTTTVRTILDVQVEGYESRGFEYVDVVVTADGFLYNMMRNIVGSLVDVGKGVKKPEWIGWLIEQKDRGLAGKTAAPQGLSLEQVFYAASDEEPELNH